MGLDYKNNFHISLMILVLGVCLDEVSTFICLQTGLCYESNPFAFNLISRGLWTGVDFLLILLFVAIPLFFSKFLDNRYLGVSMMVPVIPGVIRMAFGASNLALLLSIY